MNYARFKVKTEGGINATCTLSSIYKNQSFETIKESIENELGDIGKMDYIYGIPTKIGDRLIIGGKVCKVDSIDLNNRTFGVHSLEDAIPKFEGYAMCIDGDDVSGMPTLEQISDYISKHIGMIHIVDTSNKDHDVFTISNFEVGLGYKMCGDYKDSNNWTALKMVWLKIYPTEEKLISTIKKKD